MRNRESARGFSAELVYASKGDLTAKEKVMIKDVSGAEKFDDVCKVDSIIIDVDWYAILDIHNEAAVDRKDYRNILVVGKDGRRFITGSTSFMDKFEDIFEDLEAAGAIDEMTIEVYTKDSAKRQGKYFITCRLV